MIDCVKTHLKIFFNNKKFLLIKLDIKFTKIVKPSYFKILTIVRFFWYINKYYEK